MCDGATSYRHALAGDRTSAIGATELLSAPVDVIGSGLRKAGLPVPEDALGSST